MNTGHRFSDTDLRDARLVGHVAEALRDWEENAGRRGPTKPLREAIWFYWQSPRLPRPRIRGKYPVAFPWTAAARDSYHRDPVDVKLVIEHTEPMTLVMDDVLREPRTDRQVASLLTDRLACVVVTRDEDRRITAAGYGLAGPDGDQDPLARYRAAGIDVDRIAPLDA